MNADATTQGRRAWSGAALVLAAHGSTKNSDSSRPTHQHAVALLRRGLFAEVAVAFWKEDPPLSEALSRVASPEVYIVPNFISEGYFTRTVLPREFGLDGPVTERGGRTLYYCKPVGSHRSMTAVVLHRALAALGGADPAGVCLIIVGHGTDRDENSAEAVRRQVEAVRVLGRFGEVRAAFLEQEPAIGRWRQLTARGDVVVVPFFIGNGMHSFEDIPRELGLRGPADPPLDNGSFARNPRELGGRRLWYTPAIGTEPRIADVILDMVEDFDREYRDQRPTTNIQQPTPNLDVRC